MMEAEDIFVLRGPKPDHPYFSTFANMREGDELCDVTLRTGSQCIRAHRVILSAGSPYFRAMFKCTMKESTMEEIPIEDVDPISLRHLISYLYTFELRIRGSNVQSLLDLSMYLQIPYVIDACLQFMRERIDPSNACTFREYADSNHKADLLELADNYLRENFGEVSSSEDFSNLRFETLKELVSRDDLHVMGEYVVFEAVVKWIKEWEDDRVCHLPELLRLVRMPLLTAEYFTRVSAERLILESPVCRDIVNQGKKYHSLRKGTLKFCSLKVQERCNKAKHHLKCAKVMGYGMYTIYRHGLSDNNIDYYDPFNRTWSGLRVCGSWSFSYVICTEEKIYFLWKRFLRCLHLKSLKFTEVEHKNACPDLSGVVYLQRKTYFFGGLGQSAREVCYLDLDAGIYVQAGRMTVERREPGVVRLGDSICIMGGHSEGNILRSAERYNPVTEKCNEIAPMRVRRYGHGCEALKGKIYVYGGISCDDERKFYTSSGEVYDPQTDQWNFVKEMKNTPGCVTLVSLENKLHAFHYAPNRSILPVTIYDPDKDEWKFDEQFEADYSGASTFLICVTTHSASLYRGNEPTLGGLDYPSDEDVEMNEFDDDSDYNSDDGFEDDDGPALCVIH